MGRHARLRVAPLSQTLTIGCPGASKATLAVLLVNSDTRPGSVSQTEATAVVLAKHPGRVSRVVLPLLPPQVRTEMPRERAASQALEKARLTPSQ